MRRAEESASLAPSGKGSAGSSLLLQTKEGRTRGPVAAERPPLCRESDEMGPKHLLPRVGPALCSRCLHSQGCGRAAPATVQPPRLVTLTGPFPGSPTEGCPMARMGPRPTTPRTESAH